MEYPSFWKEAEKVIHHAMQEDDSPSHIADALRKAGLLRPEGDGRAMAGQITTEEGVATYPNTGPIPQWFPSAPVSRYWPEMNTDGR